MQRYRDRRDDRHGSIWQQHGCVRIVIAHKLHRNNVMPGDNAAKCFAAEHAYTSGFPRPWVFQIITNQLEKQTGRRELLTAINPKHKIAA